MRFRSNNPVYRNLLNRDYVYTDGQVATYRGVASKTMYFIAMILVGAFGGLMLAMANPNLFGILLTISIFTTFIFALIALISPRASKVFGTLYCLGEGMLVGVVSLAFETVAPGSVMIAILSTIVVLTIVATLFLTNIVKVNGRFMRFLTIFALSMMISMILIWILNLTVYQGAANMGLNFLISALMVFLATLYLMFDLENIRQVVEGGAPKELEWFASFGLVFTIVWLYLEILPIIARVLASRD